MANARRALEKAKRHQGLGNTDLIRSGDLVARMNVVTEKRNSQVKTLLGRAERPAEHASLKPS
jgi:hypothetical protein